MSTENTPLIEMRNHQIWNMMLDNQRMSGIIIQIAADIRAIRRAIGVMFLAVAAVITLFILGFKT